jgi:hypothetical protein
MKQTNNIHSPPDERIVHSNDLYRFLGGGRGMLSSLSSSDDTSHESDEIVMSGMSGSCSEDTGDGGSGDGDLG